MDLQATAELAWPPAAVFAQVRDLGGYPAWLGIVHRAVPAADRAGGAGAEAGEAEAGEAEAGEAEAGEAGAGAGEAEAAWLVDLGARLGPMRRSKRVRMVRVTDEAPALARFERIEDDGRSHSQWVLTARIDGVAVAESSGSRLTMHLHYGGRAWLPLAELAVRDEMRRAGPRLGAVLEAGALR